MASAIVGTGRLGHLQENIDWAGKGKLDDALVTTIRDSFRGNDSDWRGQV